MTKHRITYHVTGGHDITMSHPEQALSELIRCADYDTLKELLATQKELEEAINLPNPDKHHRTPLNQAVITYVNTVITLSDAEYPEKRQRDLIDIIDLLLSYNANPNITTTSGKSMYTYIQFDGFEQLLTKHDRLEPSEPIHPLSLNQTRPSI